jgi:hypothetical protein
MKYISFSLWGGNPLYTIGSIKNVKLCKLIYQDWKIVLYYNKTVPQDIINELEKLNIELIDMSDSKIYGCFWRFLVSDRDDCEYAVFRDCDSRVSIREKLAVDEWINSGKSLHVMRDHPYHMIPYGNDGIGILAGMWGIKGGILEIKEMILQFIDGKSDIYGIDQSFLKIIYSKFQNDRCTHDEFFEKKPFPLKREPGFFIGGRIGADDKPVGDDYKLV